MTLQEPLLRRVFCAVNFCAGAFVSLSALASIVSMESPYSFLGGIVLVGPCILYCAAEGMVWRRKRSSTERLLAYANLASAAFLMIGVVTTIGEFMTSDDPIPWGFLLTFSAIGIGLSAYVAVCGFMRLQWTRGPKDSTPEHQ